MRNYFLFTVQTVQCFISASSATLQWAMPDICKYVYLENLETNTARPVDCKQGINVLS